MAKKKQKYYVVWEGLNPGIYESWTECQLQIKGFNGAKYKSFKTLQDAQEAFAGQYEESISKKSPKARQTLLIDPPPYITKSMSVDAACSGNPGIMEYRGVWTGDSVEVFKQGPFQGGTNNVGEFLALVHALAFLQKKDMSDLPIYSDSRTAMAWVRNKKVKTQLKKTAVNAGLFKLIDRAIHWLNNNTYTNPIIKWDTKSWGEIPADFGRK